MLAWPTYSLGQTESDFEKLTIDNMTRVHLNSDFQKLRKELIEVRDEIYERHNFDKGIKDNQKYTFDLEFGLFFYQILSNTIENRDIYEDDIWRYLSVRVIPDIVHARWGLDPTRYYKESRRIYLKQIWWYIHLGWHKDASTTFDILKDNSTDTIQAMVERPGLGYNINLYREIMRQYSLINNISRNDKRLLLRRVMVLNTARGKTIAPELAKNGVKGYVKELYEEVM